MDEPNASMDEPSASRVYIASSISTKPKMTSTLQLDSENSVHTIQNALTLEEQYDMIDLINTNTLKQPTLSIYGNRPKFYDTTFNFGTVPSGHYSQAPMTQQASDFSELIRYKYTQHFPNSFTTHFNCNLVYYSPDLGNGGRRGKHQDNPDQPLNLVLIYSFGQDRTMTFYKDNKKVSTIQLLDNSIVAMVGPTFQKVYYHQLDSIKPNQLAFDRYSFNTRYK